MKTSSSSKGQVIFDVLIIGAIFFAMVSVIIQKEETNPPAPHATQQQVEDIFKSYCSHSLATYESKNFITFDCKWHGQLKLPKVPVNPE